MLGNFFAPSAFLPFVSFDILSISTTWLTYFPGATCPTVFLLSADSKRI